MSNRINDSITSSEYSIAIDPEDEEALLNKANGLFSLGNFTDAMDYYQRFLKLCPDEGAAYMFLGNCLLNLGRPEEAMPQYNKALECYEKCNLSTAEVNQCRAFTLSLLGHVEQALECLNETLKDPDCNRSEINVIRGHILLENGRVKEAIKSFVKARSLRISLTRYSSALPSRCTTAATPPSPTACSRPITRRITTKATRARLIWLRAADSRRSMMNT